jgi:hypothetical protein
MQECVMRAIIAVVAAALLAATFFPTEASARMGGGGFHGGGFHGGGFHGGGFHGGGFGGGFRGGFRGGFHGGFHHHGFRRFGPRFAFGAPFFFGAYAGLPYGYGDDCLAPRRIWTPYGWRVRWVNVCY